MLPTNYSRYKYTPDEMPQEEFLERFVVREEIFEEIFKDVQTSDYAVANQHYIIIGQRGQGKTTLLRKLQIEVENDTKLAKFLIPVKFAEEQYQIRSLSCLWEEVADYLQSLHEETFPHVLDDMEKHFEDDDYELKAFSYLDAALKKKKKKLLLLIDNIDELIGKLDEKEQRRLREILLSSSSFRIVGGSTKMLEQHYDYGKPFYEFFKIIKLKGFTKEESIAFLRSIGKGKQKERMEEIIKTNPARIETLRQLTGGVPRTLVMLFDIFLDEEGNAFDDLLKVLDEATPLYKHRIDELPNQLQEIVHTIAINWDGIYTAEIAKKTRLSTKVISAQLGKLEKYDIIESEQAGKNKIYKIKERFFNIWYLMRFGRKRDRQRVKWLVKVLEIINREKDMNMKIENEVKEIMDKHYEEILDEMLNEIYNRKTQGMNKNDNLNYTLRQNDSWTPIYKSFVNVIYNDFDASKEILLEWMRVDNHSNYTETRSILKVYFSLLSLLLSKEQYYRAKNILENKDYNLKEKHKPIWYALMTLMQDDFPHEIKKMGSELQESVNEVLKKVEEYKVKYGD